MHGAGGFLQTTFRGYPRLRVNNTALQLDPQLVPGATAVRIWGACWRGNRIDMRYNCNFDIIFDHLSAGPRADQPLQFCRCGFV